MDFDVIRETLFQERLKRGWTREVAARRISKLMRARATAAAAEDAHLPPVERRSLRGQISGQGLNNWEMKRSRPSFEDLMSWAEALDHRAILELAPASVGASDAELQLKFGRLGTQEQKAVLLYADLLGRTTGPFQTVLARYPEMMAESLPLRSSDRSAT